MHHIPCRRPRRDPSRPAGQGRHADAPFPERPLLAAERPIAVQGRTRPLVAALERGPMIAREDDQRFAGQIERSSVFDQPADVAVEPRDHRRVGRVERQPGSASANLPWCRATSSAGAAIPKWVAT